MTREAVSFRVAANAGLQALPRRLAVTRQEKLLAIMETGTKSSLGDKT